MRLTRLGATILEGHDIADLPLVSENAEILDNALLELENAMGDMSADDITLPNGKTVSESINDIVLDIGDKTQLDTTDKTSLVAAINELKNGVITQVERNKWDQTSVDLEAHRLNNAIHVSLEDRNKWDNAGGVKKISIEKPNNTDDLSKGYNQGDLWLYEVYSNEEDYEYEMYQCLDNKNNVAKWVKYVEEYKEPMQIYGVKIDENNSNPETAVTYTDMATGFTPSFCNNGDWQMGSWEGKFPYSDIKPVLFKDGQVIDYLDPNDYTKNTAGETVNLTIVSGGDVMVEFPKIYWKIERVGTDLYVKYSDVQVDSSFKCLAHTVGQTEHDKIYLPAYRGHSTGGRLRSLSGKTPTGNQTIGQFRNLAQANGAGYQQACYYPMLMLQVLALVMGKNRDTQTQLGRGFVDGNSAASTTGNTNQKGMFYGENTGKQQNKFCGIEDFYGNQYLWIDGMFSSSNRSIMISDQTAFNDNGSGYVNHGIGASADVGGWISGVQGGTETGFIIKESNGSTTTYYADAGYLRGGRLPDFGGSWNDGDIAGAFYLNVYRTSSTSIANCGGALCFIGVE